MMRDVIVITKGNSNEDIEKVLLPFKNFKEHHADCDWEHMEFCNVSENFRQKYEVGTIDVVVMEGGVMLTKDDPTFKVVMPKGEKLFDVPYYKDRMESGDFDPKTELREGDPGTWFESVVPEKMRVKTLRIKDYYPTLNDFACTKTNDKYHKEFDAFGYWRNPNSIWDTWMIHGKSLSLKTDKTALYEGCTETYSARIADINWEKNLIVDSYFHDKDLKFLRGNFCITSDGTLHKGEERDLYLEYIRHENKDMFVTSVRLMIDVYNRRS